MNSRDTCELGGDYCDEEILRDLAVRPATNRAAAMSWLDAEWPAVTAAARAARSLRPGLTIALPVLVQRYLDARGRLAELIPLTHLAQETARHTGDRRGEAIAYGTLGVAPIELRRYDEAVPVNEYARALMRETGDRDHEGRTSRNLGSALRHLGRHREAAESLEQARVLFHAAGVREREGLACRDLGRALRDAGRGTEAAAAFREAVTVFTDLGDDRRLAEVKGDLSRIAG